VIATRQQVGRPNHADNTADKSDDSFLAVAREIVHEEGVTGLWLGLKPGLVLTANPAITYGVFERVKGLIQLARARVASDQNTNLSPGLSFLLGAFSKTLATVVSLVISELSRAIMQLRLQVTYPYIMAKVRIQARRGDEAEDLPSRARRHPKNTSALRILARVLKREGFPGWYQVSNFLLYEAQS